MRDIPPLLADLNFDAIRSQVYFAIKIVAGVIAAGLGWFLASPLFRMLYRLFSPRKGIPGGLLFPLRLVSALGLGFAVFWYLPLGGGSGWGGFGPGGGPGDGPGKGKGDGTNQVNEGDTNPSKTDPKKNKAGAGKNNVDVEIEIVPGKESKKYYLLKQDGQTPATFEDIKKRIIENKGKWRVQITFSRDDNTPTGTTMVYRRLEDLLNEQGIPHSKGTEPDSKGKE